jgi:inorganic pyrophosphatase
MLPSTKTHGLTPLQYYKVVKGDGPNTIVGEVYQDAATMQEAIAESHRYWEDLLKGREDPNEIALNQTSQPTWCKTYISSEDATEAFNIPTEANVLPAATRPEEYDRWYYLDSEYNLLPGQLVES